MASNGLPLPVADLGKWKGGATCREVWGYPPPGKILKFVMFSAIFCCKSMSYKPCEIHKEP